MYIFSFSGKLGLVFGMTLFLIVINKKSSCFKCLLHDNFLISKRYVCRDANVVTDN